jgi:acyl transferase domain-containing protein
MGPTFHSSELPIMDIHLPPVEMADPVSLHRPPQFAAAAHGFPPRAAAQVAFYYRGPGGSPGAATGTLYKMRPVFRDAVDECRRNLPGSAVTGTSPAGLSAGSGFVSLFVLQYAATRLLHSWGVVEDERFGHWLGDAVAACIAGDLAIAEALQHLAAIPAGAVDAADEETPLAGDVERWAAPGARLIVEIGPPPRGGGDRFPRITPGQVVHLPLWGDPASEKSRHWQCVAALYAHGVNIDWQAFYGNARPISRRLSFESGML